MRRRLRVAYFVDGRMARGSTGSGHHIRNFFGHLRALGVEAACFDSLTGRRLNLLARGLRTSPGPVARARSLSRRALETLEPALLRAARQRRRAYRYLRETGRLSPSALQPIRGFAPDFLLGRMSHANTFVGYASRHLGVPYGLECNAPILTQEQEFGTLVDLDECRRREAELLRGAAFVTFVADAAHDLCQENPSLRDVPAYVVRNCADSAFFEVERSGLAREHVRRTLAVGPNDTLATYVGSFKPWHHVPRLLAAAEAITDSRLKILLVGWGPDAATIQTRLRRAELGRRVIMTGVVEHDAVPGYLGASDLGVQPGANAYSAPLKLIEYMAAGLAAVAPRVPPIEELLIHDSNAWLFDQPSAAALAPALLHLHQNKALQVRLGRRAHKDVANFTWRANAERVLEIIDRHCPSPPSLQ